MGGLGGPERPAEGPLIFSKRFRPPEAAQTTKMMDVQNNETPIRYKEVSVNGSADQKHRVQNSFRVAGKNAGNRQKDWFDVMGSFNLALP